MKILNIKDKKVLFWVMAITIVILIVIIICFIFIKKTSSKNAQQEIQPVVEIELADNNNISKEEKDIDTEVKEKQKNIIEDPIPEGNERFIVQLNSTNEQITNNLFQAGFITDIDSFLIKLSENKNSVIAGGYKLSKEMTPDQINKIMHSDPYMKWVVIKPGLRKEEIANILAQSLNWSSETKSDWITKYTTSNSDYIEGVYYPDTYLIPVDESLGQVTKRLINKFNENFSAYQIQFTSKNIKWTKALILASIVQREAANNADMPLIAGILWNRLNQDMYLGVDATLQYARGDTGSGWWAPITIADKQTDSLYNTYKYKGLPPTSISNPSIYAFDAVLNPTETNCLYYLHDKNKITHCSTTYEEHQQNIQTYLVDKES